MRRLTDRLIYVVRNNLLHLSNEMLLKRPNPQQWSIAQCMEHLNKINVFYLDKIEKAIKDSLAQGLQPKQEHKVGWMGKTFVQSVYLDDQNQPIHKSKTPRIYMPMLGENADAKAVLNHFIALQLRLFDLLEQAGQANLKKMRLATPSFFVKMSLGNVLLYLVYHNQRHVVQAHKALYDNYFASLL